MTPERWRKIERLYHAAVEREPAERAAFLTDACAGDESLCREVQSLLDARPTGNEFMEDPAAKAYLPFLPEALRSVGDPKPQPAPGRLVGRSLGTYQLQALIGAGGMGEVYRAVDTRLNRTIAIKVLPAGVSNDAERRDRFRREAKIVSSLNHPHICALYDVGVEDGIQYLVMEHIEGETLHDRLKQGPVAPARALEYCLQICDALDKAHRQGIVHRDLKPANIMLTRSGVKLLDFSAAIWGAPAIGPELVHASTESAGPLTATGVIVGTPQYLSPEQLEGRPADRRSDIFMFGAVAYEMLTGKSAFSGGSQARIISAILKDDPPALADVVPDISSAFARSISRCLSKDPDDRWQTATDLLFQLQSIGATGESVVAGSRSARRVPGWVERVAWVAIAAVLIFATYVATDRRARPVEQQPEQAAIRFTSFPPEGTVLHSGNDVPFALSPDGSHIVFVGDKADGTHQLWLRQLMSEVNQPIAGTEGANTPFWSPDSQWIGFFTGNELRKIHVSSGVTQLVASNVTTRGGATWNANGAIVFPATIAGLSRVSADGGAVSAVTTGEGSGHFWPQFVGDGTHFIYAATSSLSIDIGSLSGEAPRTLMKFPVRVSSLAYVPEYVFFVQNGALFGRPFDDTRLEFSGEAVRILEGIPVMGPGRAAFSVSGAGVLAYWPYPVGTPALLRWYDRSGRPSPAIDTAAQYVGFALSPDDHQLLFSRITKNGGAEVWIRNLGDGSDRQLTFDGASYTPQWSPDGTSLAFTGPGRNPPPKLRKMSVARAGTERAVGESPTANFAASWSGDGDSIVSVRLNAATSHDLWVQDVRDNSSNPLPFNTASNESDGKVSPDGRWIAYVTDASGKNEVRVARFPSGVDSGQVSVGGGESPQWASGGSELLYLSGKTNPAGPADRSVIAVTFNTQSDDIVLGTRRPLFTIRDLAETDWSYFFPTANTFAAAHDGQRFLAAIRTRDPNVPPISFVVNWRALLKRSP